MKVHPALLLIIVVFTACFSYWIGMTGISIDKETDKTLSAEVASIFAYEFAELAEDLKKWDEEDVRDFVYGAEMDRKLYLMIELSGTEDLYENLISDGELSIDDLEVAVNTIINKTDN